MSEATVVFSREAGVARVRLNRPDRLNSFNERMHEELRDALACVRDDRSLRVLLLTGTGRGFCAGQDLGDRTVAPGAAPVDLGETVAKYYAPLVRNLRELPLPVVCAVNGVAAGAGVNMALACDIVVATRSAKFIEPFCKLGLIPDTGGTWFLPRRLGTARAMGLALLGEALGAEQAEQWGLIWKCVDDAAFADEVERLLRYFATGPTLGFARTKHAIHASESARFEQQLELEVRSMHELGFSRDYAEGVAAFVEKRKPSFTGK
ncbi:MAG: 2-(1,2-epoxy-1,2-dihydrophenyl)acetyl-CoA isomerase PaaG [Rhodanobacteraceae bacterium]